jgi:hypothetical protein
MIAKCQSFEAVHGKTMRNIYIEALTVDNFFHGIFVLWLLLVFLLRTFGDDELMAAFVNNAGAHWGKKFRVQAISNVNNFEVFVFVNSCSGIFKLKVK